MGWRGQWRGVWRAHPGPGGSHFRAPMGHGVVTTVCRTRGFGMVVQQPIVSQKHALRDGLTVNDSVESPSCSPLHVLDTMLQVLAVSQEPLTPGAIHTLLLHHHRRGHDGASTVHGLAESAQTVLQHLRDQHALVATLPPARQSAGPVGDIVLASEVCVGRDQWRSTAPSLCPGRMHADPD